VDGEAHGDEGGEERDDEHRQGTEDDVEEAVDAAELELHAGTGYRVAVGCGSASLLPAIVVLPLDLLRDVGRLDAEVDTAGVGEGWSGGERSFFDCEWGGR
jgi:hypothetical protein